MNITHGSQSEPHQHNNSPPPAIPCLREEFQRLVEQIRIHVAQTPDGIRALQSIEAKLEDDRAISCKTFSNVIPFLTASLYEQSRFADMTLSAIMEVTKAERAAAQAIESEEVRRVTRAIFCKMLAQSPSEAVQMLKVWDQHYAQEWKEQRSDQALRSAKSQVAPSAAALEKSDTETIAEKFRKEVPAFARVSKEMLDAALSIFQGAQALADDLAGCPENNLRSRIDNLRIQMRQSPLEESTRIDFYATISEVWCRTLGHRPHSTQILATILLGLQDQQATERKELGYYQEIATGEGKSLIAALHATYTALQGGQVVITTFNEELARSAANSFETFFDHFRISSGAFSIFDRQSTKLLDSDILYSTSQDLIFRVLYDKLEARLPLRGRRWDLLLADEADVVLFDQRREICRVSCPSEIEIPEKLWQTWIDYVDEILADPSRGSSVILNNLRGAFGAFRAQYETTYPVLTGFDLVEGAAFMRAAIISKLFKHGRDFVVRKVPLKNETEACEIDSVVIVDFKHTGRIRELSHWSHGLHQFVAARHGLSAAAVNGTIGQMAHADFARKFDRIACISGSWGGEIERAELRERMRVDGFSIPRHQLSVRSDALDPYIFKTPEEHRAGIHARLEEVRSITPDRPTLLVCESIEESQALYQQLHQTFTCQLLNDENDLDTSGQKRSEAELLKEAGMPGVVTITHKMSGRGSDIKLDPRARAAGGLFVLQAYLAVDQRDQVQVWGRAARQGDPGGACTMACFQTDTFLNSLPASAKQIIDGQLNLDPKPHNDLTLLIKAARLGQATCEQKKSAIYEAGDRLLEEIQTSFFSLQARRRGEAPDAIRELLQLQDDLDFDIGVTMRSNSLEGWWVSRFRIFDCRVRNPEYVPLFEDAPKVDASPEVECLRRRFVEATGVQELALEPTSNESKLGVQLRFVLASFAEKLQRLAQERAEFHCHGFAQELDKFKSALEAVALRDPGHFAISHD